MGREAPVHLPVTLLRLLLILFVTGVAAGAFALMLAPTTMAAGKAVKQFTDQFTAPSPEDLSFPRFPERSTIYAADGKTRLATLYLDENRKIVRLQNVAPVAQQAVLASEDKDFYEHGPLDLAAIIRAIIANWRAGEIEQGASTITQQLIKGVTNQDDPTLKRKLDEARLAFQLEQQYTKDEILELYLNEIYYGRGSYGIQAAAEFYFATSAKRLDLAQSATLAQLIPAPEAFNPVTAPDVAMRRRNRVIDEMLGLGWTNQADASAAKERPLGLSKKLRAQSNRPGEAPYFVEYVRQEILRDPAFGENRSAREHTLYQGGLKIITTLDPNWLQYAKDSVTSNMYDPNFPQAAVVTVDANSGAIRTLLGGTDFKKQKFDIASQGRRQAGSSFKPFTLAAALEQGIPAGRVYDSSPKTFTECGSPWTPHNAEGGSEGYLNLYQATARSVNLVFARLIVDTGPQNVVSAAHRMGITSDLPAVCSLTLGSGPVSPLEMASAYATLANDGVHCQPYAVQRAIGPNGKLIKRHRPKCTQAIESRWARQISDMLRGVVTGGTGTAAALYHHPVVGKTGTTNDHADGWFVGYTWDQVATAVWVGDIRAENAIPDLPGPWGPLFGGNLPATIWHDYMDRATASLPVNYFPPPPPIPRASVPNVIGKPFDEAVAILAEANFTATVQEVDSDAPAGTVVAQSPGPGASVTAGSLVTLSVSTGEAPNTPVPNVVGRTLPDARQILQNAGFAVKIVHQTVKQPFLDGIVIGQDPNGGKHKQGSTVVLTVGKYQPEPSPPPSPPPTP